MVLFLFVLAGVVMGLIIPINIPGDLTHYVAVGLLAACNTLFGGISAKINNKFVTKTFVIGFFSNTVIATLLTVAGNILGVNFSFAAIVYFGTRIFNNIAKIQHSILQKTEKRYKIKMVQKYVHGKNENND